MKISNLIIMFFLCLFVPLRNCFAEEVRSGNYSYEIQEDGTACIIKYFGNEKELHIPDKLDDYPVSSIGKYAFYSNKDIISVMIPEGIKTIENNAFSYCDNLISAAISEGTEEIRKQAFYSCLIL